VSSGRVIQLKGFTIKAGKLVENEKRFNVSKQLKRRPGGSKRVRVARKKGKPNG
jgi:hypothetical protein